ncbi:glycerol-3-phosphate acyltransferase [Bacillus manliponensis]|uniref:Glycerol-3-phosphate acyltransferase n=1 Tax=Bacillus manliponensis TaxID=574376 RepID=A0A073JVD5_9BACI|nr:glycerol-3-phosphate 1-O-acyltransferase PlsY [Bacillus manliponensis]KEK18197.1 glycerol-3-phosphate acyltransferase [Bacillus manliponensis]
MISMNGLLYVLVAYAIGGILTAYILTKWKHHADIRELGSGNPGARNMGRVYGKGYFAVTFVGDALKGAIVVYIATFVSEEESFLFLSLLAVILGHLYPIWTKFSGGKGISTFIGGLLVLDILVTLTLAALFVVLYALSRSFTKAGLLTITSLPIVMLVFDYTMACIMLALLIIGFISYAHRK